MARQRRCIICEKWFEIGYGKVPKRYCSNACRQKAYRIAKSVTAKPKPRETLRLDAFCAFCGVRFVAHQYRQLYCSHACKQAAYRERKATHEHSTGY